ncbi:PIG-L family deacetylase [Occallatibacter savannae]|uniref:PIG-L family deacetylase n=1 Tax=Occallatibacter savannae TaxID=1002691 RepID=UPI000D697F9C|nr:PIG-L family deacetylase [Occallatibacter savannae]
MFFAPGVSRASAKYAAAASILAALFASLLPPLPAQQPAPAPQLPSSEPQLVALPLPEDRGEAKLEQTLKRLGTTASMMFIVAHPDDEDGSLLTYLSRGLGVRVTSFTLTRGEGGQNAMSADTYDALGIIRTNELLRADEFYGAKQLWGTEVDFGFSKTQEEAFQKWGHDRVLYDAVLAVRRERPQVIVSTFVGGITDGHGQHQVSGEIAQEVFKAAPDPNVFPDQLKPVSEGGLGLQPWQPLAVYSRTPFAPVTSKGMFDYATGKWSPAKFRNYITGESSSTSPSSDAQLPVGSFDFTLGRTYGQIAHEGWGEQKSQYGGAAPLLSSPATGNYHLWAVASGAQTANTSQTATNSSLYANSRVHIDTSISGIASSLKEPPQWLTSSLKSIENDVHQLASGCPCNSGPKTAQQLAPIYRQTLALREKVNGSALEAHSKAGLLFELDTKINEFQSALADALGLDMIAFRNNKPSAQGASVFRGASADESATSVSPGQDLYIEVHAYQATTQTKLDKVWLESRTGDTWKSSITGGSVNPAAPTSDPVFTVHVADNAEPTKPYFTRPDIEQPYYDVSNPQWRGRSFAPYPLDAWAEFSFDGLPIRIGKVVQALQHIAGQGSFYEPLVVTPAIGVSVDPSERILPLDGRTLPVRVSIHTQGAADGTVSLNLPQGWRSEPATADFHRKAAGDSDPIVFSVTPAAAQTGAYAIKAVARSAGRSYESGWRSIGYPGLRPYNQYSPAQLKTRKVDVKLAPGLRVGYVMGPGDLVPEAMVGMGLTPQILSKADLISGDLSNYNVIVVGIRAYSVRPELTTAQPRLDEFVRNGGTVIVQYQSGDFPAPLPLSMNGRMPERVVDEDSPVKLLDPSNPILTTPNTITSADFSDWVEERGHGFLDSWDPGYTALTETADPGQDPQRGGLLVTRQGKGTYIYVAYALYRQLPELVPGAYRIFANLLSAGTSGTQAH